MALTPRKSSNDWRLDVRHVSRVLPNLTFVVLANTASRKYAAHQGERTTYIMLFASPEDEWHAVVDRPDPRS